MNYFNQRGIPSDNILITCMLATIVVYSGMSLISRGIPADLWDFLRGWKTAHARLIFGKIYTRTKKWAGPKKKTFGVQRSEKIALKMTLLSNTSSTFSWRTRDVIQVWFLFWCWREWEQSRTSPNPQFDGGASYLHASNLKPYFAQ